MVQHLVQVLSHACKQVAGGGAARVGVAAAGVAGGGVAGVDLEGQSVQAQGTGTIHVWTEAWLVAQAGWSSPAHPSATTVGLWKRP